MSKPRQVKYVSVHVDRSVDLARVVAIEVSVDAKDQDLGATVEISVPDGHGTFVARLTMEVVDFFSCEIG